MTKQDLESELPELDASEERRLSLLLRHAFAPSELDPERHEQLLSAALEDPFAPASPEEIVESERLRRALEGHGDHPDLALARALAQAHSPGSSLPRIAPEAVLRAVPAAPRRPAKVIAYRFGGAAALLAVAAAVLLAIAPGVERDAETPNAVPDLKALAQSRSTAPLFQADSAGPASARIDRIASSRERELRDNRYAQWGVR